MDPSTRTARHGNSRITCDEYDSTWATHSKTTLTDLGAEIRFDVASVVYNSAIATVAAIVLTRFIVVAVVAVAVSLPVRVLALGRWWTLATWIQALALQRKGKIRTHA